MDEAWDEGKKAIEREKQQFADVIQAMPTHPLYLFYLFEANSFDFLLLHKHLILS
jgi:hypothetical protein